MTALVCGRLTQMRTDSLRRGARQCQPCGSRLTSGPVKLTSAAVVWMREQRRQGVTMAALAAAVGVSKSTVHGAVHGRSWKSAA